MQLGRDEFLASAAPAALVRYRGDSEAERENSGLHTMSIDQTIEETLPFGRDPDTSDLELFPLTKKPQASYPDRITIGRTVNNDVVIADASVSRFHAYVRRDASSWVVADAGSKNGSWLEGEALEARREKKLVSGSVVKIGEVEMTFYLAVDLYRVLGGR
jgi:hypothetical protein